MISNGAGGVGRGLKTKLQTGGIQMVRFEAVGNAGGFNSLKQHRLAIVVSFERWEFCKLGLR